MVIPPMSPGIEEDEIVADVIVARMNGSNILSQQLRSKKTYIILQLNMDID